MPIVKGDIWPRAMESMYGLEWEGRLDYLLLTGGDDPTKPVDNITRKYNEARDVALKNDYDALLTQESDTIVPRDALKRLAVVNADVAYGLYVWRRGQPFWTAYSKVTERRGTPISKDRDEARRIWGKVVETKGVGMGCTLIHRCVLEAFPFRKNNYMGWCCDWALALDCQKEGFTQKHDLGVICGHIERDPGLGGMSKGYPYSSTILWPDPENEELYRIEPGDDERTYMSEVRLEGQSA